MNSITAVMNWRCWRAGNISEPVHGPCVPQDGAAASAAFTGPDGESVTLWRDETGTLTGAEIARDGRKILTLEITDWTIE